MAYLRHLVAKGAAERWGAPLPAEVSDRLEFELSTIEHFCNAGRRMDFGSYFLVVQDYVAAARRMGVWVGPGRGSAAGSAVAYALGITGVDPIKHGLLFERFLNPDRISMPDIDIDFDDEERGKVVEYICNKYGRDHVAHIVSFGQMAPKSVIKDVSRVVGMSIEDASRLAGFVSDAPRMTFSKAFAASKELRDVRESGSDLEKGVLRIAERLEGCVRQSGIHACGIVVSPRPLSEVLPVSTIDKDCRAPSGIKLITQYDGRHVETVGLLRFDIVRSTTLSLQKLCVELIKERKGLNLDLEKIPYDDPVAMQLFASGDTMGICQFESDGMKEWLRALKPTSFNELVAMNALYRPGLMECIPAFVRRKNGEEPISYDHPLMESVLRDTCGVTIYQEQMMLLSRILAGFTRSESDKMRKAMGKKMLDVTEELKTYFVEGCLANGEFRIGEWVDETEARKLADKIWNDWYAVASYVFNKSHAVAYAWLAYQSAYLKAHYPAEFMLSMMLCERGNMTRLPELLQEARRMGLQFAQAELDMVQYRHE
jgi:DNA polymerase-3 subunit alpha